jgi:hypothetical protein
LRRVCYFQLKLPPGYPELDLDRLDPDLDRLEREFADPRIVYAPTPPRGLIGVLGTPTTCAALFLARILLPLAFAIRFVIDFLLNIFFTP